jgi:hypothetical protein
MAERASKDLSQKKDLRTVTVFAYYSTLLMWSWQKFNEIE